MSERAAIYLRVSTTDGRQTTQNQLRDLRLFVERTGWTLAGVYEDQGSGRDAQRRPNLHRCLDDAGRRLFDYLVVWDVSRFTREGSRTFDAYLARLEAAGVGFRSYQEPYMNTSDPVLGPAVRAIVSAIAKAESDKMSERIKSGLRRRRAQGGHVGGHENENRQHVAGAVAQLAQAGKTTGAKRVHRWLTDRGADIGLTTVKRELRKLKAEERESAESGPLFESPI